MSDTEDAHDDTPSRVKAQFLPIANVTRVMKHVLPENTKIAKGAKMAVQECAAEFIGFITGESSDRCWAEKRKTITADDLLLSAQTLGFGAYVDPLREFVARLREFQKHKKEMEGGPSTTSKRKAARGHARSTRRCVNDEL